MIEETILDNGLTIYTYVDKRRHINAVEFVTKVGGHTKDFKYNNKEYHFQDGIAHILEHYIVEENDNGNFLNMLGSMQMSTNASTSSLNTDYYFSCVENLEEGIKIILDGVYSVSFTEEKLNHLKNPIYQEIRSKLDNRFYNLGIEETDNLFHNYNYRSTGGTIEEVSMTTIDDLKVYYDAFYKPSNQFIVIAGNFDKNKIINLIKDCYKDKSFNDTKYKLIYPKEEESVSKKRSHIIFPTPKDYVSISYKIKIPNISPKEKLNLDFYLSCFFSDTFGKSSDLYKEMIEEEIITKNISCGKNYTYDYIIINFACYTDKEELFIEKITNKIKTLDSFNEKLFELYKKNCILNIVLRDENVYKMIIPFIDNIIGFNYPHMDTIQDVKEFNFSDYTKCIRSIDFSNYTITSIYDKDK